MVAGITTSDKTFSELTTSVDRLEIPLYQRYYQWKSEEIKQLWHDLFETTLDDDSEPTCFLGPMVFHDESLAGRRTTYLVDGQQRTATITLFIAEVFHRLREHENRGSSGKQMGALIVYLGELIVRGDGLIDDVQKDLGDSELRLIMSNRDRELFEEFVKYHEQSGYHTYLYKAINVAQSLLQQQIESRIIDELGRAAFEALEEDERERREGEALVDIAKELRKVLKNYATFSVIHIQDPYDPLTVFESLNSKGMSLAQSDLIKNILIQRSDHKEWTASQWDDLVEEVESSIVQYLRYWHTAKYGFVRKKDLYAEFKSRISSNRKVDLLLSELREDARWYNTIIGKSTPPKGVDDALSAALRTHARLNFKQGIPILLGFAASNERAHMKRAVKILSILYVRLFVTLSVRGSVIEASIDDICSEIRADPDSGMDSLKHESERLIKSYCPEMDWSTLQVGNANVQKYLLSELWLAENRAMPFEPNQKTLQVEHVLPRKPAEGTFQEFTKVEQDIYRDHIGNLVLLLDEDNNRVSNGDFKAKTALYEEYDGDISEEEYGEERVRKDISLTHRVANYSSWDKDKIREQARYYAELANDHWSLEKIQQP
jgi:hypothetical protein